MFHAQCAEIIRHDGSKWSQGTFFFVPVQMFRIKPAAFYSFTETKISTSSKINDLLQQSILISDSDIHAE